MGGLLVSNTIVHERYRIKRLMGKGGMGAVYEAVDVRLKTRVALKQMLVSGTRLAKAFQREAQILASLRHPSLPVVSDYFSEGDDQFLVMQFIPGPDLAALLSKRAKPFPVEDVLSWADQLLKALTYLHRQHPPVIHRDIKPQNLKLTSEGEIVLIDFGLAKGAAALQSRATNNSSVYGYTPQYAALEQIQGSGTDARSDLYALAATVYHLITNTRPVNALERAEAAVNERPDPLRPAHEINPNVPVSISALLIEALSLRTDKRPLDAAMMRAALLAATADLTREAGDSKYTALIAGPEDTGFSLVSDEPAVLEEAQPQPAVTDETKLDGPMVVPSPPVTDETAPGGMIAGPAATGVTEPNVVRVVPPEQAVAEPKIAHAEHLIAASQSPAMRGSSTSHAANAGKTNQAIQSRKRWALFILGGLVLILSLLAVPALGIGGNAPTATAEPERVLLPHATASPFPSVAHSATPGNTATLTYTSEPSSAPTNTVTASPTTQLGTRPTRGPRLATMTPVIHQQATATSAVYQQTTAVPQPAPQTNSDSVPAAPSMSEPASPIPAVPSPTRKRSSQPAPATPVPPTPVPPTAEPPTSAPATSEPPTDAPPTSEPPTDAPPTPKPSTAYPPPDDNPTDEIPSTQPPDQRATNTTAPVEDPTELPQPTEPAGRATNTTAPVEQPTDAPAPTEPPSTSEPEPTEPPSAPEPTSSDNEPTSVAVS